MRRWALTLALAGLGGPQIAGAAICNVPTAYSTVQAAVNDLFCTEVVLAAQAFSESVTVARSLILRGAGSAATTIVGSVRVEGAGTAVDLRELAIDATAMGAIDALAIDLEAAVAARDVVTRNGDGSVAPLFADGFESGDTSAWSAAAP